MKGTDFGQRGQEKLLKDDETKDKENDGVVDIEQSPKQSCKSDA